MTFNRDPPRYHTFLVTMWEERNQDEDPPAVWRFRLEYPRTGRRQGFTSLAALAAALEQEIESKLGGSKNDSIFDDHQRATYNE